MGREGNGGGGGMRYGVVGNENEKCNKPEVRGGAQVPLWHVMLINTNTCMVGSGN